MNRYVFALVALLALTAGCTSGPTGTSDAGVAIAQNDTAPTGEVSTFHIETEYGRFFCIAFEHSSGTGGHLGLSCRLVP
jgi:hypothetical protein